MQKLTVLPLQDMKRETMMIPNKKKVKLANEDTTTRRNPVSTSGIYLTAVKVAQCRHVVANRREMEEAKIYTSKEDSHKKGSSQTRDI